MLQPAATSSWIRAVSTSELMFRREKGTMLCATAGSTPPAQAAKSTSLGCWKVAATVR
ncbi:hypothetical protein Alg215_12533 [Pyrenophora tritici-repentis]|nr:hypothetical protein Alg215_12533 [Pyrenophora tritici-repentis]